MDFSETTRILFNRIKKMDPENLSKIIGYLFLQGYGDQEMIDLAMSPDVVIQELIHKAKAELDSSIKPPPSPIPSINLPNVSHPFSRVPSRPFLPPLRAPSGYWEPQLAANRNPNFIPMDYLDSISQLQNHPRLLSLEDHIEPVSLGNMDFPKDYVHSDAALCNLGARMGPQHPSLNEIPLRACHYFKKGFCKHGSNCRYFHGNVSEGFPKVLDASTEDYVFSPASLENLEREIVGLLKSRKGNPVSIASLPMLYYEKFGKLLQAEGYLTESQRQGKAGYSLTKLLAKLKNSIRLIDRPHGQHAVILAEDAPRYMENRGERNDCCPVVSGSRQIYLTFPAESTFTEDDVSEYFNNFGPVADVRIPCQQKRMFGFVTFESADTVKMILDSRNPHFVCGSQVLVKRYIEKSKLVERKYQERIDPAVNFSPHFLDIDSELHARYETSRLLRKRQLMDEQEQAFELERRHLAELQKAWKPDRSYFCYSMDELKVSEDNFNLSSTQHFNYLLDVLKNDSASDGKISHTGIHYTDHDSSQELNLPESPFGPTNN